MIVSKGNQTIHYFFLLLVHVKTLARFFFFFYQYIQKCQLISLPHILYMAYYNGHFIMQALTKTGGGEIFARVLPLTNQ